MCKTKSTKVTLKDVLPTAMLNKLEEIAIGNTPKTRATNLNRLKHTAAYMLANFFTQGADLENDSVDISTIHFRLNIGTDYLPIQKQLLDAGLFQWDTSDYKYKIGRNGAKGRCKKYAINTNYLYSDPAIIDYQVTVNERQNLSDPLIRKTVAELSRLKLSLSRKEYKERINTTVTPATVRRDRVKVNEEIPTGDYCIRVIKNDICTYQSKGALGVDKILAIAKQEKLSAILYKNTVYIEKLDRFINKRVKNIRLRYEHDYIKLSDLRNRANIICSRNDTNNRLDTNLTSIHSDARQFLTLDGEPLKCIDLVNSQFCLFANLLEKAIKQPDNAALFTPDFYTEYFSNLLTITTDYRDKGQPMSSDLLEFIDTNQRGKFYETFAAYVYPDLHTLPITEFKKRRGEAKATMFLTCFSKAGYNPISKQVLRQHYPTAVGLMDAFKLQMVKYYASEGLNKVDAREKGNAALAVMLQSFESFIFIDTILNDLLFNYRLSVFSVHDSILCKVSDYEQMKSVIVSHLDTVLGTGKYKLNNE